VGWFDVRCYIVYYYYILYLYYTYYIIILYYTLLFFPFLFSYSPSPSLSNLLLLPIFILYLSVLTYTYLYSIRSFHLLPFRRGMHLLSSSSLPSLPHLLFNSLPMPSALSSQYSKYTCRYLHILIYILSGQSSNLSSVLFLLFPIFILYLSVLTYTYLYYLLILSQTSYLSNMERNTSSINKRNLSIYQLIPGILVGTWIHIFIFNHSFPKYLTPHVLSEWMGEV